MQHSAVPNRLLTVLVTVVVVASGMGLGAGVVNPYGVAAAPASGTAPVAQSVGQGGQAQSTGDQVQSAGSDGHVGTAAIDEAFESYRPRSQGPPIRPPAGAATTADDGSSMFDEYGSPKVVRGTKDEFVQTGNRQSTAPELRTVRRNKRFQALETTTRSACPSDARQVTYDVSAINVKIPLNQFGDNDPRGRMYVLDENIDEVRAQEQSQSVTAGLHNDPIQPLVVRANLGDCVTIDFTNRLDEDNKDDCWDCNSSVEPASIHVHRGMTAPGNSGSHVGTNQDTTVDPGNSTTYTYYVEEDEKFLGTWYMHSHGNREQVSHGLFGALMIEPKGSVYLDPHTGETQASGWAAIIDNVDDSVRSFREFAIFYHAVGPDDFQPSDEDGREIDIVDDLTGVYRPCSKALNYRSECHIRRMELMLEETEDADWHDNRDGVLDESLAYSSYTFGDPATPMPKTYMGDPTKIRLVGGGAEVRHVHHLHGGGIRWRFQPNSDPHSEYMFKNLTKEHGDDTQSASQRLDSQSIGPGETYTNEIACGGGGCQRSAGDFLYHCHLADHYISGMWAIWRNYDTLQDDLVQLEDRVGATPAAVNSTELLGTTLPDGTVLTESNIDEWIQQQLPPQGVPDGYDATVWNWKVKNTSEGPLYLGEPLDTQVWANYDAGDRAGERPEILFNPENGRIAYPLLTPHLAERPPFAPGGHGPAPYLSAPPEDFNDLTTNSNHSTIRADPQIGDDQLCPAGSPIKRFNIVAIDEMHKFANGSRAELAEVFTLARHKDAMLGGERPLRPLVYRANVGDCVTLTLTSELQDNSINNDFAKVNIHPHFIQFDTQASDGVITGKNYETSVRPYKIEDTQLASSAQAGDRTVDVKDASDYREGITFGVGLGETSLEVHRIESVDQANDTITLAEPLVRDHAADEYAGVEFVRYKYFVDADFGTVFFHDHVLATHSFPRGLVGALIVEPRNSTYHDPQTGEQIKAGPIADIRTNTDNRIADAANSQGESFREAVMVLSDDRKEDIGTGAWINLRSEPLDDRVSSDSDCDSDWDCDDGHNDCWDCDGSSSDTSASEHPAVFSSVKHDDPYTDVVRAYEGDPVVFRTLDAAANAIMSFRVSGHEFRLEHFPNQTPRQSIHLGPSERFDLMLDGGAGEAGDYMYYVPQKDHLRDGQWGIFRVHDTKTPKLEPLPDRPEPPAGDGFPNLSVTGDTPPDPAGPGQPCPGDADVRHYDVTALNATFDVDSGDEHDDDWEDDDQDISLFTLDRNVDDVRKGTLPHPLVLRAAAGECLEVTLTNELDRQVSLQLGQQEYDPQRSGGITVGFNYDQATDPGENRTYRAYVDDETGAAFLGDFDLLGRKGDSDSDDRHGDDHDDDTYGLYGAVVTAPAGSTFHDPETGQEITGAGFAAVVNTPDGAYRDFALLFQEQDPVVGTHQMPYQEGVEETSLLNYRAEPIDGDCDFDCDDIDLAGAFAVADPSTPVLRAYEGEDVVVHAIYGNGFQDGVFHVQGHAWRYEPETPNSSMFDTRGFGPHAVIDARLDGGAGPPGDYLVTNHRMPYQADGQWGLFRVHAVEQADLVPLSDYGS